MPFPPRRMLSLLLLSPGLALAAAAEQAGVSAAVHGRVSLERAAAPAVPVKGGDAIYTRDALRSGPASGMQLLLLDQTTFTLGPDTEVVVDEFVYDPKESVGKVSARITQGVFRFVSGRVAASHPEDVKIGLSSGTVGIRGTMVVGKVDPATRETLVALLGEGAANDTGSKAGAIQVCNAGQCVDVRRAGYGTRFDGPDAPPVAPFPVPPEQLEALTRSVSEPRGSLAGARAERSAMPDVAAGHGAGDPRSPTEVSGEATASGAQAAGHSQRWLGEIGVTNFASVLPRQGATGEVDASDAPGPAPVAGFFGQPNTPTTYGDLTTTTLGQLSAATLGGQQASYQASGLRLTDGGSYDFSLLLDVGRRRVDLGIGGVSSPSLGIQGGSLAWSKPFGGDAEPVLLDQKGRLSGSAASCAPACDAFMTGIVVNANGRFADSVLQGLKVVPNASESVPNPSPVTTVPSDHSVRRP